MGKLAERLADERRSGVYRVEVTGALEEASALDRYPLLRVALDGAAGDALLARCARVLGLGDEDWAGCAAALADPGWRPAPGHVLLFSGFESAARAGPGALAPLIGALRAAAASRRERGARFFAVFLDPARLLALDPLYDRRRHAPADTAAELEGGRP